MKTFSYDPTKITDGSMYQMRFVLGDTATEGGEETCALCDEEYLAIIEKASADGRGFSYAQYCCLAAIMQKFSFEVDFSVGGMSLSLSKRYERFRELWLRMQKQHQRIEANPLSLGESAADGGHYFYTGMHDNPRVACSVLPFRGD